MLHVVLFFPTSGPTNSTNSTVTAVRSIGVVGFILIIFLCSLVLLLLLLTAVMCLVVWRSRDLAEEISEALEGQWTYVPQYY